MPATLQERVVAAIGDQYDIEGEIGRGGMAVVYRAVDRRLKRLVAIKVLPPELAYDPAIRTRFTREAQTSAQLAHPHIVPIYDVGERDGLAYFVMALIPGGTLGALLAAEPRQEVGEARRLICEVADALAYAHVRGVIHRDVKPENILLDADTGRAFVTDFGIARAIEAGTRLTITGNAIGTPTYMSPEQATGEREVDGRSDVYSLGVIGYQMLTGRVPFAASNSMALLLKHVSERPRPIAELRPDAPRAVQDAVERALCKAPEDRWPTAAAMRDALSGSRAPGAPWRAEPPAPTAAARTAAAAGTETESDTPSGVTLVPPHLAGLTPEQRADLRLWGGRVHLFHRVRAARWLMLLNAALWVAGLATLAAVGDVPPAILAPIVPIWMTRRTIARGRSLRASGLRLRRVYGMLRTKWVVAPPAREETPLPAARTLTQRQLRKLVPAASLDTPEGRLVQQAAEDRAAIVAIYRKLPRASRSQVRDVQGTANALVQRVAHLAQALHRLDESIDPALVARLDARLAELRADRGSLEGERRIELLERQRDSMQELIAQRAILARQLDSAALALGTLRLDLVRFRASGHQASLRDLTLATQQGRALSRDIGNALAAMDEVGKL